MSITDMTTTEVDNHQKYGPCEERTIILMGRTRTGKTTIANVLATTLHEPVPLSIYSDTRQTNVKNFFTTDKSTGTSYRITIIDTPGFFDITRDDKLRLKNEVITDHIIYCMKSNIRHAHLIGIVFNLANGINERDIESMIYIQKNFRGIENSTALVITNCEHLDEGKRKKLIEDFFKHQDVKRFNLKDFFRQGVLFMGSLRPESLSTVNDKAVYLEYKNVLDMRTAFIEKCIQCTQTVSFQDSACSIM